MLIVSWPAQLDASGELRDQYCHVSDITPTLYDMLDIEFRSGSDTIRGWLYTPDDGQGPFPLVTMAGGWCYVKELVQPYVAEEFAGAGLAAILFDYRNFGASDGDRRQHIDPNAQLEDYREHFPTATSPTVGLGYFEVAPEGDEASVKHVLPALFAEAPVAH